MGNRTCEPDGWLTIGAWCRQRKSKDMGTFKDKAYKYMRLEPHRQAKGLGERCLAFPPESLDKVWRMWLEARRRREADACQHALDHYMAAVWEEKHPGSSASAPARPEDGVKIGARFLRRAQEGERILQPKELKNMIGTEVRVVESSGGCCYEYRGVISALVLSAVIIRFEDGYKKVFSKRAKTSYFAAA